MSLMICENAGKCMHDECGYSTPHEKSNDCNFLCTYINGITGSKCIPYVPASKPFETEICNGVQAELNAKAFDVVAPLTDHAKYCRLSKQVGGLCGRKNRERCGTLSDDGWNVIKDWTQCPRPEKQQSVDLPKPDPLEELVDEYNEQMLTLKDNTTTYQMLKEFAEKVRAL